MFVNHNLYFCFFFFYFTRLMSVLILHPQSYSGRISTSFSFLVSCRVKSSEPKIFLRGNDGFVARRASIRANRVHAFRFAVDAVIIWI